MIWLCIPIFYVFVLCLGYSVFGLVYYYCVINGLDDSDNAFYEKYYDDEEGVNTVLIILFWPFTSIVYLGQGIYEYTIQKAIFFILKLFSKKVNGLVYCEWSEAYEKLCDQYDDIGTHGHRYRKEAFSLKISPREAVFNLWCDEVKDIFTDGQQEQYEQAISASLEKEFDNRTGRRQFYDKVLELYEN